MCNTHKLSSSDYDRCESTAQIALSPFLTCPVVVVVVDDVDVVRLLAAAVAEAAKVLLVVQEEDEEEEVAVEVPNWAIACDDDAALQMHSDETPPLVSVRCGGAVRMMQSLMNITI